jgi:hypothetical protein
MPTFKVSPGPDQVLTPNQVRDRVEGFIKNVYDGGCRPDTAAGDRLTIGVEDPDRVRPKIDVSRE